jgi:hypothetical protein
MEKSFTFCQQSVCNALSIYYSLRNSAKKWSNFYCFGRISAKKVDFLLFCHFEGISTILMGENSTVRIQPKWPKFLITVFSLLNTPYTQSSFVTKTLFYTPLKKVVEKYSVFRVYAIHSFPPNLG